MYIEMNGFSGKHPATLQLMREDCSYTNTHHCLQPGTHSLNRSNVEWTNRACGLTRRHMIKTRILLVESPKLYRLCHCATTSQSVGCIPRRIVVVVIREPMADHQLAPASCQWRVGELIATQKIEQREWNVTPQS